jgi:hypothetical protein
MSPDPLDAEVRADGEFHMGRERFAELRVEDAGHGDVIAGLEDDDA